METETSFSKSVPDKEWKLWGEVQELIEQAQQDIYVISKSGSRYDIAPKYSPTGHVKEDIITDNEKGFMQGYIASLVIFIKALGPHNTDLQEAWFANKMSIKKLIKYGVSQNDIEVIEGNWNELNRIS